jgi:transposase
VLSVPAAVRIWLATEPVDMRMSFRGLSGIVRGRLRDDPQSGHLFCFLNARRTMMKLLLCDRTGFWIFYKRLSGGTFELPAVEPGATRIRLDAGDLALILEGIDLATVTRRKRHYRADRQALET